MQRTKFKTFLLDVIMSIQNVKTFTFKANVLPKAFVQGKYLS